MRRRRALQSWIELIEEIELFFYFRNGGPHPGPQASPHPGPHLRRWAVRIGSNQQLVVAFLESYIGDLRWTVDHSDRLPDCNFRVDDRSHFLTVRKQTFKFYAAVSTGLALVSSNRLSKQRRAPSSSHPGSSVLR